MWRDVFQWFCWDTVCKLAGVKSGSVGAFWVEICVVEVFKADFQYICVALNKYPDRNVR